MDKCLFIPSIQIPFQVKSKYSWNIRNKTRSQITYASMYMDTVHTHAYIIPAK
jgi:hypothetical protein